MFFRGKWSLASNRGNLTKGFKGFLVIFRRFQVTLKDSNDQWYRSFRNKEAFQKCLALFPHLSPIESKLKNKIRATCCTHGWYFISLPYQHAEIYFQLCQIWGRGWKLKQAWLWYGPLFRNGRYFRKSKMSCFRWSCKLRGHLLLKSQKANHPGSVWDNPKLYETSINKNKIAKWMPRNQGCPCPSLPVSCDGVALYPNESIF